MIHLFVQEYFFIAWVDTLEGRFLCSPQLISLDELRLVLYIIYSLLVVIYLNIPWAPA